MRRLEALEIRKILVALTQAVLVVASSCLIAHTQPASDLPGPPRGLVLEERQPAEPPPTEYEYTIWFDAADPQYLSDAETFWIRLSFTLRDFQITATKKVGNDFGSGIGNRDKLLVYVKSGGDGNRLYELSFLDCPNIEPSER
jgi:hypothetical protein